MSWPVTGARPAPIASLAKMMTAYQILTDHPLGAHANGPALRVTDGDVRDYHHRAAEVYIDNEVLESEEVEEKDEILRQGEEEKRKAQR